jgi:hypothetical protein
MKFSYILLNPRGQQRGRSIRKCGNINSVYFTITAEKKQGLFQKRLRAGYENRGGRNGNALTVTGTFKAENETDTDTRFGSGPGL